MTTEEIQQLEKELEKMPIINENCKNHYSSIERPWEKIHKYQRTLPSIEMTAYDFLYECNKNNLDDIALIYAPLKEVSDTKITYRDLFKKIDEVAKSYQALGIKKGDIVTVSLPSFVENIINLYALNKIGAVANQIHPIVSQEELDMYLKEVSSKILVGYGDIASKVNRLRYRRLEKVIIVDPKDSMSLKSKLEAILLKIKNKEKIINPKEKLSNLFMSWQDFIKLGKQETNINVNKDGTSLALITHTSGTTGKSKGVMTDSRAMNFTVSSILKETDLFQRHDRELLVLPPFPLYIISSVVHLALITGIELVVIPSVDYNHISDYFKKYHPNHVKGIPHTIEMILQDKGFDNVDLSNFKFLISGGGKLTVLEEANKFLKDHNCKYSLANGYGMSEAGGCITCMFENTKEEDTVGRPLIGTNVKILSLDSQEEIPYDSEEYGEIWLSSPSIMQGYYGDIKATKDVLRIDEFGNKYIKTGDLGKVTKDGNLKVTGRIKRMTFIFDKKTNTVSKMSNDYVESTLCENENVFDCVVVPVENEETINALKAYVVVKDKSYEGTIEELDELCKVKFRKYTSPIEYIIVDNIPKTNAGKNAYRYVENYEKGLELDEKGEKIDKTKMKVLYRKKIKER